MAVLKAIWNPARDVWETESIDLFSEHSDVWSETWPTSGMTRNGVVYALPTPEPHTVDTGYSSLPTPRASRGASGTETMYALGAERSDENRPQGEVILPTPRASDTGTEGRRASEGFRPPMSQVIFELLKTPTSQLAVNGGSQHPEKRKAGGHGPTLADEVEHLLPTPVVTDAAGTRNSTANRSNPNSRHHSGSTLTDVLLPTPTTQDASNTGGPSQFDRNSLPLNTVVTLLPTPAANDSGNTPEQHLRKKPGREVVTSLMVLVDHGLIPTGGRMPPPSNAGNASPDA